MQQPDYAELQSQLADRLREAIPEIPLETVQDRIRTQFERVRQEGKIDSLSADEVALLRDYRLWRTHKAEAVGGVFHWKRTEE